MSYQSPDGVNKHRRRGEMPTAGEWNAIARAAGADVFMGVGGADGESLAIKRATNNRKLVKVFAKEATIPEWSVFGIKGGIANPEVEAKFHAVQFSHQYGASPASIFTNGGIEIKKGRWGWAHIIDTREPTLIKTAEEIPIGHQCGPKWGDWTVTAKQRYGLVAISKRNSKQLQWVYGTHEPIGIVGRVIEAVTAFNPETDELGFGKIRAYFREKDTLKLKKGKNPANDSLLWEFGVYNLAQRDFDIGDWVKAENVMGVGLVVESVTGGESDSSESLPPSSSSSSVPPPPSSSSSSSSSKPSSSSSESLPPSSSGSECNNVIEVPIAWELDQSTCTVVATQWQQYSITFENGRVCVELGEIVP